ncbi:MAG TPA: Mur ligase family protein, partial [Candidatus Saccharimonadales bacterium]|nr:Mur ligase family protein [Candidatus Saccharimonadales bacterium]
GGTAIGPLALIAHKAGFQVSGSDKQESQYIQYLRKQGVTDIHIGQSYEQIAQTHQEQAIDWFVYTSALPMEQPDAPELRFCAENAIRTSKRDEFLNHFLGQQKLQMIAIAGTHGKTTTTAMTIWLFKQLGLPISYSVGAKMSFGDMGEYNPESTYFVYEADEFDRNFLSFEPRMAIITGIDYDHPDIYPTLESYNQAFHEFLEQSEAAILWQDDAERLKLQVAKRQMVISKDNPDIDAQVRLPGLVNRQDAWIVARAIHSLTDIDMETLIGHLNAFPGVGRRFEQIIPNLYSDYAHTPPKIRGALQIGREVASSKNLVVVYEGLHNTRQHFIQEELRDLFADVQRLYIVPSYLAREDPDLPLWSPQDLRNLMTPEIQQRTVPVALDNQLATALDNHLENGDVVLCITAGGGGSLDEWLRQNFTEKK